METGSGNGPGQVQSTRTAYILARRGWILGVVYKVLSRLVAVLCGEHWADFMVFGMVW